MTEVDVSEDYAVVPYVVCVWGVEFVQVVMGVCLVVLAVC